jgi:hypothetical protein
LDHDATEEFGIVDKHRSQSADNNSLPRSNFKSLLPYLDPKRTSRECNDEINDGLEKKEKLSKKQKRRMDKVTKVIAQFFNY